MPGTVTVHRRGLRASTFALVLTASAVLAHVLAGGSAPSAPVVAGCGGVLLVVGWVLAGRDLSATALSALALSGQLLLHVTFCLTMPGRMTMASMLCGHPTQPVPAGTLPTPIVRPGAMAMTSHQMLLMMLAHTIGGAVVLLALRSVEAVAAVVAGVLAAVLLWALPAVWLPTARRRRPTGPVFRVRVSTLLVVSPRRGPPVSICA